MTTKTLTRSAIIPLLMISGGVMADVTPEQLKTEITNSESRIQQTVIQGDQKLTDNGTRLNAQLKVLQDQQESTRQSIQELKSLQQQLSKQMQQSARKNMSDDDKKACPIKEPGLATPDGKLIFGESEWVFVEEANGAFQSRVDTGAATSSISATDITVFEREGKRWVKFKMPIDDAKSLDIEAPFVRYVRIKQASATNFDRRPVVRLTIQIGSMTEKAEFSLRDRSEMDFSLLLGREFIKDVAVVDVAREFVQPKPNAAIMVAAKKKTGKNAATVKDTTEDKADTKKNTGKKAPADTKKAAAPAKKADSKPAEVKPETVATEAKPAATPVADKSVSAAEPAKDTQNTTTSAKDKQ